MLLRKRLAASVAAAPLLFLAHAALADTTISAGQTTPVQTSTAGNVTITSSGAIKPTAAGPMVTIDSNNTVTNQGTLMSTGVNGSTAIQANAGVTSSITNSGTITVDEDYTPTDTNNDGNLDGPFAQGSNRFGIVVSGAFTGPISNTNTGVITIEGNNSGGIIVAGPLTGNFENSGTVQVTGTNGYGIHLGQVNGNVRVQGTVAVTGAGSTSVALDGNINGSLVFQGAVTTTGYRYTSRPSLKSDRDALGADDGVDHPTGSNPFNPALFSGPAVRITGSVTGGVLFDVAPTISTSATGDNDGDGILDKDDTDQDNDGVADATETSASVTSVGGAPAVVVGSDTQSTTLGVVGTGIYNYGFVNRGAIGAAGLYDGVNAVGVQFGGNTGQTTVSTNGLYFGGSLTVSAFEGNATGIHVTSGAQADTIVVAGVASVTGISDGNVAANLGSDGNTDATVIKLDAGSTVHSIYVSGTVVASGQGEQVNAVVLRDLSGSVTYFENTGHISASIVPTDDVNDTTDSDTDPTNEVVHGKPILADVQAASAGVTIREKGPASHISADTTDANGNGVYDADEPTMVGNILFGAHDDRLEILAGAYTGDVAFGAGNDTLLINGSSIVKGAITDSDGALDIQLIKGSLTINNTDTIAGTNLTVGSGSSMTFTADPGANHVTRLDVGTANIAAGTKIGLRFTSLLSADTRFTVIHAGSLTAGALDQSLLGNSPYLYVTSAGVQGNDVYIDVTRRTAAQIGLNKESTAAFDAVYASLFNDSAIQGAFLAQTSKAGFLGVYDQMLPSTGQGVFSALMVADQAASDGIAQRPDPHQRYGPDSFWIQEVNTRIQRDTGDTEGSDTKAFGFVAGYESMGDGGALGLTMSYVSAEERGSSGQVGEQSNASLFEGGVYYRGYAGNLSYMLRGGVGFVHLESDRKFIYVTDSNGDGVADTTSINRTASARWNGYTFSAGADVAYEARFGRFYARPSAGVDYLYFSQGGYTEGGGGAGFNLTVDGRSSQRLDAEAMLALGAEFGRDSWWRPEIRIGYRQRLAGSLGDTVARFSGGNPFTISSPNERNGALVLGFSLRAGTAMSYLALEGDSELSDLEMRYLVRLVGRVMF